ncbi:hypothetical protein RJT34_29969 [Clitoria ternatea]|uniref:Uncharacterized protein n=1 Tax=Clitoria ternatea TaxID=43366 RepID=A0AAN9ERJ1_CLITE
MVQVPNSSFKSLLGELEAPKTWIFLVKRMSLNEDLKIKDPATSRRTLALICFSGCYLVARKRFRLF